jgi:hypothetical protein
MPLGNSATVSKRTEVRLKKSAHLSKILSRRLYKTVNVPSNSSWIVDLKSFKLGG